MIPAVETVEHCASVHPDCTTNADPEHIDRSTSDWKFEPIARAVQMPTVYRDEDGRVVVINPPIQESVSDLDFGIPRVAHMPTVYTDCCGSTVVIAPPSQDSDCGFELIPRVIHMPIMYTEEDGSVVVIEPPALLPQSFLKDKVTRSH